MALSQGPDHARGMCTDRLPAEPDNKSCPGLSFHVSSSSVKVYSFNSTKYIVIHKKYSKYMFLEKRETPRKPTTRIRDRGSRTNGAYRAL